MPQYPINMPQYTAEQLRQEIASAESRLRNLKAQLTTIECNCHHFFGEVKYTPKENKAYTIPGDAPGTMGVDWRGPTHVPASTDKIWTRTCTKCGKVESTSRTKKQYVPGPIAGTSSMADVPDFGESHWSDKVLLDDRRF